MIIMPMIVQKTEEHQDPTSTITSSNLIIEEEEKLLLLIKRVFVLQGTQGMITMQLKHNQNTFLFMLFLVPLLQILVTVSWLIVVPQGTLLVINKCSLIWLRGRPI